MKRNDLFRKDDSVLRVIHVQENRIMFIDCMKCTMPVWMNPTDLCMYAEYAEEKYYSDVNFIVVDDACICTKDKAIMYERYAMVTAILPFVADEKMRSVAISKVAEEYEVSKQSVRSYLCRYLAFNHIQSLLPQKKSGIRELTQDEKNIRWSLNKFFYNKNRNSLKTAYTMMLKEKYCDAEGNLLEEYPSYYQYRYFYRKHRKLQNYYISREGLSAYQRDYRPLVGGNIQTFASCPGVGMIDGTVCDIYLVDDAGRLVGRPLLVTCVDAYSGMCLGYSLTWEGGVYALRNLMLNVVADKVEHCKNHGISISPDEWCNNQLPYKLVSDQGSEYICDTFSQLIELGVQITNLPPYRPELKSWAELLFRLLQDNYKKHLRNKGVIEVDYQERGSHDYRKDACQVCKDHGGTQIYIEIRRMTIMGKQIDLKALLESKMGNIEPMEGSKIAIERAEMNVPHNLMFDAESSEFKPETKPVTASGARGLTVEEAKSFDDEMNRFIDTVLIGGVDYGIIPNCKKPTLLKSGAEKILNYLGLIARTEISNRVEDYNIGFFSYEAKVYLIDYNGVVKGEGIGITNTREGKYAKTNGYAVQNTVLKMAKKRALVDAALNVGNLSARFTQDVEDMNIEPDNVGGRNPEELKPKASASKPATKKQITFLEKLMGEAGTSAEALNRYVKQNYDVEDYRQATSLIVSELIEKFQSVKQ